MLLILFPLSSKFPPHKECFICFRVGIGVPPVSAFIWSFTIEFIITDGFYLLVRVLLKGPWARLYFPHNNNNTSNFYRAFHNTQTLNILFNSFFEKHIYTKSTSHFTNFYFGLLIIITIINFILLILGTPSLPTRESCSTAHGRGVAREAALQYRTRPQCRKRGAPITRTHTHTHTHTQLC